MRTGLWCSEESAGKRARSACQAGMAGRGGARPFAGRATRLLAVVLLLALPLQYAAAIQWDAPWDVRLDGQRLSVETFSSRMPPDAVARELARSKGAYQRYLVGDGRILLSGLGQGEHWLVEIQGWADGSQGYVSALYFDAARINAPSVAASPSVAGETAAARLFAEEIGSSLRLFEFEPSVRVGLVAWPAGVPVASEDASMKAGSASAFHLIPVKTQPGMAVAVSMPEH